MLRAQAEPEAEERWLCGKAVAFAGNAVGILPATFMACSTRGKGCARLNLS